MAIEPLGSNMTIQSQTIVKVADKRSTAENRDVSATDQTVNIDIKTIAVPKNDSIDRKNMGADTNEQQQASDEKIKKALEQLNKSMPHSEAVFGIHEDTKRVMIKIVDKDTKEIIREFPPEETLDMIAKVWELAGILVDEKR